VNGAQVGTIADLLAGVNTNVNNGWQRFSGTWNSGSVSGPITVRIVNLQPSLPGNDFAIDDISFGTLSTFIELTSPVGSDNQTICQNSPIDDITYAARSSTAGPTVSGLPPGVTTSWNGVTLSFTGTPTASGTFNYTITTTGNCLPATATGTITILATPTAGIIASDQTICSGGDPLAFTSTTAGTGSGVITYLWESNTNLATPSWTTVSGQIGATYDVPAGLTTTTQYRRTTIATSGTVVCVSVPTELVQVTLQAVPTAGAITTALPQTICSGGDPSILTSLTAGTGSGAITYIWESAVSPFDSWSPISGVNSASYNPPAGLMASTRYRRITVSTLNGVACESDPTPAIEVIVQAVPTPGDIAAPQTICIGGDPAILTSLTAGTGSGAITYIWESTVSPFSSWSPIGGANAASYNPPAGLMASTRYRRITVSTLNSVACESIPTAPIEVTVQTVTTAGAIAANQTICEGGDPVAFTSTTIGTGSGAITYRWESAMSPFSSWSTISGASLATYNVPSGLAITTQYRRVTVSTLNGTVCESTPTAPIQVTVTPNNTVTPVNPNPALCLNTISPIIITHITTGATGIVPQSASVNYNLPNGVTPNWNAGVLTISGTPTEFGVFNYSIPLTGGCGSISATGIITVENPTYPIVAINVVNPTLGSAPPFTSTFTIHSKELTIGTYTINYSIDGASGGPNQTIPVTVTTPGEFTFTSLPYSNEGTTILTINSIKKDSELCTYYPPNNNTVPYGVSCSKEFLEAGGNGVFYVPAGIIEVTIDVFGEGLGGDTATRTISVKPGGAIFAVFDGANIFATVAPPTEPMADRLAQAIVSTIGGNGRIVINYNCTPLPPCTGSGDVFQYTDSEGFTVIRFTGDCAWSAPVGLDEFEVLVVGGGGGGGFGEAAGGGGGGSVIYQQYLGITMNGLPGLQNAVFQMTPGGQGQGASSTSEKGESGFPSSFIGPAFNFVGSNTFTDLNAPGGGGGGSTSADPLIRQGETGASGGGGAAHGTKVSQGGSGTAGNNGGIGYVQIFGSSGAGGGGVSTLGGDGTSSGSGAVITGGSGGNGMMRTISGEEIFYGAGGGGTASGAIKNEAGFGGSQYTGSNGDQFFAGGNGNNNGLGEPASTYGSGAGAGRFGGSSGFQGVIYIRFPNFRILPLEYLYFNAKYNSSIRSGDLNWATAKEWENDRFEIERSVNDVKSWETIGEVAGAGYSDKPVDYAYQDMKLPLTGGNIFYRLKQFGFDGAFTYSDTRAIKIEPVTGMTLWRVFPNPTTGDPINLEMIDTGAYNDEKITVRIISATGVFDVIEGISSRLLSDQLSEILRRKAAGIYTFEISWGNKQEYHKVILRR
jgi:hypothetical protein